MPHTVENKKPLMSRVRRIQGQAVALERAIESEVECSAVLQQIAALRGAVQGLMREVLEGHIRGHLGDDALSPAQRAAETDQLIAVLRSYLK